MPRLLNFLLGIAYVMASAAAAVAMIRYLGLAGITALLGGFIILLICTSLHAFVRNRQERRRTRHHLDTLTHRADMLEHNLSEIETLARDLLERFDVETRERDDRLVAEMRVIEALVKRLAESGGTRRLAHDTDKAGLVGGPLMSEDKLNRMSDADLLETIRHSLEDNRVDLYLQPIVTLPQRKIRFYEALTRLRSPSGEIILPRDYMRVAESAGMMPTVDNLLLFRCIQIVRSLSQRNRDTGLFCNISANSLLDADFFPQFVEYMEFNKDLASQLVFEFSQSTMNGCGPVEERSLATLARLGFKFSMDQVSDLHLDYGGLHDRGFRYIKIPAETLLEGAAETGTDIHPGDLKELMARFGLNLIVDRIESERTVIDVLEYDVDYGQGYLFGGPRPVRDNVLRPEVSAA